MTLRMVLATTILLTAGLAAAAPDDPAALASVRALPVASDADLSKADGDWLVVPIARKSAVYRARGGGEIVMANGLIRRTWRVSPNAATIAFDNLMTGASILRAVEPEAKVELDGTPYAVGGLVGQPDHGYLTRAWADALSADPAAMRLVGVERGPTRERFAWKRVRHSAPGSAWPPPGVSLRFDFAPAEPAPGGRGAVLPVTVSVYYEMYDGLPLIAKWLTIQNRGDRSVRLNRFTSEILAAVEPESAVDARERWQVPNLHIESDYAFGGMDPTTADRTTHWVPDPQYDTQVNFNRQTPCLLESRPPIGPDVDIPAGGQIATFRTFELVQDSTDREREGLAVRRMYRAIAPWVTENPIMMHLTSTDPAQVRRAIDQCQAVGFEMLIFSFGSGLNLESADPAYVGRFKELVDDAHQHGIEVGGYSLLASRHVSDADDVINPKTGKPGGAIFGDSPCLGSRWADGYFNHISAFLHDAGFTLLEHDGSYPGDVCASHAHPGHRGFQDSQWTQWRRIADFYRACRADGVYLNVPDWYFLNGSNKAGMGYRETNWSLPREQQFIHARQNMYDGTWEKTPSMGWMFVPLVQYQGGGAAATIEPLAEHLDAYEAHLANCFGYGVQACYRGPRLYDTEATRALVKRWVDFFKAHRQILESDVIHLRRADGRDWDGILHVNPQSDERGLAMIFNPLPEPIDRTIELPLYYAGLSDAAIIESSNGQTAERALDRTGKVRLSVHLEGHGRAWFVIRAPGKGH